jgi:alpha-1,3-glucan synthase
VSLDSIIGEKKDFNLQKVDPNFTDSNEEYYHTFEKKLPKLDSRNSEKWLSIEEYLIKSEKE